MFFYDANSLNRNCKKILLLFTVWYSQFCLVNFGCCEISFHYKIPALFAFCSLKIQAHLAKISLILFVRL